MKTGIVVYSNDSETVWNAFRLAVYVLHQGFLRLVAQYATIRKEMKKRIHLCKECFYGFN